MFERTKLLIENGADLNIVGSLYERPIHRLFSRYDYRYRSTLQEANAEVYKTLVYLVEHGAIVEARIPRNTFQNLLNTIKNENYKATEYLVEQGIDINIRSLSEPNNTVLMRAAELGSLATVEFLLGLGADPSISDDEGRTALDYAREGGFEDIAQLLEYESSKGG